MASTATLFQWPDYIVLGVVLVASAAIGFYYAFTGGKQRSTKEYLFADKNMHWLPISCSLLASWISSLSILSIPGEVYSFGTIFLLAIVFRPIGIIIASQIILPIFYELKVVSVFKYIELRFDGAAKLCVVLSAFFNNLFTTGVVIYGPALAVSVVTGINLWLAVALTTGVALLYTVMGGMKAVLWTDTLQLAIMFIGIFGVFIMGVVKEGGLSVIYRDAKSSGRMELFEPHKLFIIDIRMRHTIWNQAFNGILTAMLLYGTSQVSVQRALSLPSKSMITRTYLMTAFFWALFTLVCGLMGLVIFSVNKFCDPIENGEIFKSDQYYPLYVMKLLGHLPGLPGFVLSAVFSGSLSTISSMMNALATIAMSDFVKPFRPSMTDRHATIVTKIITIILGLIAVVFVLFAQEFGSSLVTMVNTLTGVFGGPSFGVFACGIFLPFVHKRGVLVGFIIGAAYTAWIGLGGLINKPFVYKYPVTTVGCNVTDISQIPESSFPYYDPSTWDPQSHFRKGVEGMYDISYAWSKTGGIVITMIVAVIVSLIFRSKEKVNYKLISPLIANSKHLPQSWRDNIDYNEDEAIMAHHKAYLASREVVESESESDSELNSKEGKVNEGMSMEQLQQIS